MSREKQIEEMSGVVGQAINHNCWLSDERMEEIDMKGVAEELYDAGYRKQSENVIELPCKVGDAVYCIWQYSDFAKEGIPFIQEARVISFVIDEGVPKIIPANYGEMTDSWHRLLEVAFTKEEAEESLAKMKGGVTAESAIKAVQEAAHELKDTPHDDLLGIGSTMQF